MASLVSKAAQRFREASVVGFKRYKEGLDEHTKRRLLENSYRTGFRRSQTTERYLEFGPDPRQLEEGHELIRKYPLGEQVAHTLAVTPNLVQK